MKLFIVISIILAASFGFDADYTKEVEDGTRILSRKKRFLTFPDGSSFQLVFCTQTHGYLQVGDIVWFGHTAALAWELPTDPAIYNMFKDKGKLHSQRRQDNKLLVFLDEDGKVLSTKPYRRVLLNMLTQGDDQTIKLNNFVYGTNIEIAKKKLAVPYIWLEKPIVNPAFAKRSILDINEANTIKTILINKMHETQKNISTNIFQDLDETTINFHRDGRKSLYDKLNKFFQALGLHGKECVLRMLCESGKAKENQGTFYEEILRATFTMPRHHKSSLKLHEYDIAHRSEGDCAALYPKCEESSLTM